MRADKPRRALPAEPAAPSSGRPFRRPSARDLLNRAVTTVVVSGIAVAGLSAFTATTTNSVGVAFADQGLAISSIAAVQVATTPQTISVEDLAATRSQQLAANGAAIASSQSSVAAETRASQLGSDAEAVATEIERLKNLGKFLWPTDGKVSSVYGMRMHPILGYYRMHDGDDIGGACGAPIRAAQSGVVTKASTGYNGGSGNNVWIDHGDINGTDVATGYLHMTDYSVQVGQLVEKGDVIGHVGNTGLSTSCHLHFSLKKNGSSSDPMEYIGWNDEAKGAPTHN